jgi:hypothetical protein
MGKYLKSLCFQDRAEAARNPSVAFSPQRVIQPMG